MASQDTDYVRCIHITPPGRRTEPRATPSCCGATEIGDAVDSETTVIEQREDASRVIKEIAGQVD
jgi:hypothetical protein